MFNKELILKILSKGLLKLNTQPGNTKMTNTQDDMLTDLDFITQSIENEFKKNTVKIATEGTYPPYNFKNELGDLEGLEIDIGNEICKRLKIDCEWVETEWNKLIPGLEEHNYDVVISGMDKMDGRESGITKFTKCYVADFKQFGVLGRNSLSDVLWKTWDIDMNDTQIDTKVINELVSVFKDKTIGVQKSTIHEIWLNRYLYNKIKVISYDNVIELNEALVGEDIDAILSDVGSIIDLMDSGDGLDVMFTGPRFYGYGIGSVVRKEDAVTIDSWNKTIDDMNKDGTTSKISKKWFGRDISLP
uniref:Solute-binding protein family 3/N-terminal domain-containing protein n=1 Tax=viral metagenome TaxID=1070528 RepID=A0A6C0EHZ6_9ZZZZ